MEKIKNPEFRERKHKTKDRHQQRCSKDILRSSRSSPGGRGLSAIAGMLGVNQAEGGKKEKTV